MPSLPKNGTQLHVRSLSALQFSAGCSNLSNIICIGAFVILLYYFHKDNKRLIGTSIKVFGLLPTVTSIILNTWFGFFGNNSIWPSINNTFPFIDEYCLESMRIILIVAHIDMYLISMFVLMRTYYFFNTTKEIGTHKRTYYSLMFILSAVAILYCVVAMTAPTDIFHVTIYHNNHEQKQCELSFNNESHNMLPFLLISQTLLQIVLLILCIEKLITFNRFVLNDLQLSNHYSGKTPKLNTHIIKRFLSLSITFIITYWLSFIILIMYQWSFFPIAIIIKILIIIGSFDITNHIVVTLSVHNNSKIFTKTRTIDIKIVNKYDQISAFDIDHENDIGIEMLSTSHSEIYDIFKNTYNNEEFTDTIKWNINGKYQRDCLYIYNILLEINISSCYAQIIAEYAATQYLRCNKCATKYGFIECHLDYDTVNSATAVLDEYDNIRYYLDTETSKLTECDANNTYDEHMQILCIKCGLQWVCSNCDTQLSTSIENMTSECINCKSLICETCINSLLCELSLTHTTNENENNISDTYDTYVLCELCMDDDNVTVEHISSLVKAQKFDEKSIASRNYLRMDKELSRSKSNTNNCTNWNFNGEW